MVINAIKYTPDGGPICVRGQVIGKMEELPMAQVMVSDSSGKTKFKGGGPGLGLAIARGIVLAHGSTFYVLLPVT